MSARAVADWLVTEYNDPVKPLATLSLLLSEQQSSKYRNPSTGQVHDVVRATAPNVLAAVKNWYERADADANHRTIFYYCGHGTAQGTDTALILADFCGQPMNELDGALDFGKLYAGMERIKASEQVYFVDACRASTDTLIEAADFAGQVALTPKKRDPTLPKRLAALYYAALAGDLAYGLPGQPSLFTGNLLKSLRGAASAQDPAQPGVWKVDTAEMKKAIDYFMNRPIEKGEQVPVQVASVGELATIFFHTIPGIPNVPVFVGCDPEADNATVDFACHRNGVSVDTRPMAQIDPAKPEAEWEIELPAGDGYMFSATKVGGASKQNGPRPIGPTHGVVVIK
ncbi:MAG TPA: caspase family protein [Acidimicrobiia bacterium]